MDGHHDVAGLATKTGLELNELIAQLQRTCGIKTDVQNNLAALHKLTWHLHRTIDLHGYIRRVRVIGAPLVHGPNEIRTSRG